ncbi:DUF1275 domain-containing protein [Sphingobium fluviale]|uniref:DUF1275 domain-containing protein n=2 Tax=Sphingobium fluviale TaxID=2506423 RepID=A0A4Q1KEV8_9SPHN|nr:DUF1275 domain-containing protein [Sphingobium fluviale]
MARYQCRRNKVRNELHPASRLIRASENALTMTGTFVKAGQRIAGALLGEDRKAWLPHMALWLALVGGAVAGAAMQTLYGAAALWCAAAVAAGCCLAAGPLDDAATARSAE